MAASKRHLELQNMVATWIGNRSFKMCGLPECNVVGYIADFVAIAGLWDEAHTKYTRHSKLTKKYMSSSYDKQMNLTRETRGDIDRYYVCVFEVKVSRADFLNTFGDKGSAHAKARMKPVGTAHWVVADKGVCQPEELPEFWGLLEPYGSGLTEKKIPQLNVLTDSAIHSMAFDMLWLQMNCRSSYYDQLGDMAQAIGSVKAAILRGEPVDEISRKCDCAIKACEGFV